MRVMQSVFSRRGLVQTALEMAVADVATAEEYGETGVEGQVSVFHASLNSVDANADVVKQWWSDSVMMCGRPAIARMQQLGLKCAAYLL